MHHDAVNAVALIHSPSSSKLGIVSGSADGSAVVWEPLGQTWGIKLVLAADGGRVWAVAASSDGRDVASAHQDGHVRVWDGETGVLMATLDKCDGQVKCVRFGDECVASEGHAVRGGSCLLALGSTDRRIVLWRKPAHVESAGEQPGAGDCSSSGGWVRTACLTGHSGTIATLAFAPRRWNAERCMQTPTQAHKETETSARPVRLSSGSYDRTIRVWECGEESVKEVLRLTGHNHWVMTVCYRSVACVCARVRVCMRVLTSDGFSPTEHMALSSVSPYLRLLSDAGARVSPHASRMQNAFRVPIQIRSPLRTSPQLLRYTAVLGFL